MRSSVIGRSTTAVASALLILALGACGSADPSSGTGESGSRAQEEQGASDDGGSTAAAPGDAEPEGSEDDATDVAADDRGADGEDAAAKGATGDQTPGRTAGGECVVPEGSSQIPTGPPEVDEWAMVAGTAAPVSAQYGPYAQDGDLWTCYEHSADGALFAAAYYFAASGQVEGVHEEWLPEGDLRDEAIASESEHVQELDDVSMTLVGYRFQTYTADAATMDIVSETTVPEGTANVGIRVALMWDGDRWVADLENFGEEAYTVESLDGYSPWRG